MCARACVRSGVRACVRVRARGCERARAYGFNNFHRPSTAFNGFNNLDGFNSFTCCQRLSTVNGPSQQATPRHSTLLARLIRCAHAILSGSCRGPSGTQALDHSARKQVALVLRAHGPCQVPATDPSAKEPARALCPRALGPRFILLPGPRHTQAP